MLFLTRIVCNVKKNYIFVYINFKKYLIMRKIYLVFLVLLLSMLRVNAQASMYGFSKEINTYVPLTGGTVFTETNGTPISSVDATPSHDSKASADVTIPSFSFAGVNYTKIKVTSNGQLIFGEGTAPTTNYRAISSDFGDNKVLAPFGADLNVGANGISNIRYQTIGNETIIEWNNFRRFGKIESFNFQILLNHTTGVIKFIYNGVPPFANTSDYQPQIGIKNSAADYQFLVLGLDNSWTNAVTLPTGVTSSSICIFNGEIGFSNGLTYVFTPPVSCTGTPAVSTVSPAIQVICPGAAITPSPLTASFVNNGFTGITYQWEVSDNGTSWSNATGASATTLRYTVPSTNLAVGASKYYRLKTTCTNSSQVVYSTVSQISTNATPESVTNVNFTSITDRGMTINWTNGLSNRRLVYFNKENVFPDLTSSGAAFTVNSVYTGNGPQMVYDGTGSTVTVTNLSCSTTYYVRVYEYQRCGTTTPYTYTYALPISASQTTTATTLSTDVVNLTANLNLVGFTGSNLATVSPGWDERTGDGTFTATTSNWTNGTVDGVTTATIAMSNTARKDWIISPPLNITVNSRVLFKAALTGTDAVIEAGILNRGDKLQIMISTDACANVWTPLYTIDRTNYSQFVRALAQPESGSIPIPSSYNGQVVRIGFYAVSGATTPTGSFSFNLADVSITPIPTCPDVTGLSTSDITSNSVKLHWDSVVAPLLNGFVYEVRSSGLPGTPAANENEFVLTGTAASSDVMKIITGLPDNKNLFIYLKSNCGVGEISVWSPPVNIRTLCSPVSNLPYFENFDSSATYPDCWSKYPLGTSGISMTTTNSSAPNSIRFNLPVAGEPVFAITPIFTAPIETLRVRFKLRRESSTYSGDFAVGVLMDANDAGSFIPVVEYISSQTLTDWATHTISLDQFANVIGSGKQIAFRQSNTTYTNWYFWIDDVVVEQIPNCADVSNLAVNSFTYNSATINWSQPTSVPSQGYQYEVRTSGLPGSGNDGLVQQGDIPNGTFNYTLTGLPADTTLNVYLKSNCGTNTLSYWSNALTFKTYCSPTDIPYTMPIDATTGTALPECVINQNVNNDGSRWTTTTAQTGITGRVLNFASNSTTANNWVYTRALNLVAGQSYRLTYKAKASSTTAQQLRIKLGAQPNHNSMNIALDSLFTNTADVNIRYKDFTPTTSGVYYIGFKGSVTSNAGNLYLGEISVNVSPTCREVTSINISNITNNSVKISWEIPVILPANGYAYEIRTTGLPGTAGAVSTGTVAAGTLFVDINSLLASTEYSVYLRSVCSSTDSSNWSTVVKFKTDCDPTNIPYTLTVPTSGLPDCVVLENTNNDTTIWANSATTVATLRSMYLAPNSTVASNDWFFSRGLNLQQGQVYRLKFTFKKGTAISNQKLKVMYGADNLSTAMTNLLTDVVFDNTTNEKTVYVDFSPSQTNTYFLGFNGYAEAGQGGLYVGNISVNIAPSCLEPINVSTSGLTKNSITLNWQAPFIVPTQGYQYELINTSNSTVVQGEVLGNSILTKLISNLQPSTEYQLKIRSVCGTGEESVWITLPNFTTLCDYPDFASVTPATRCGIGTTILTATASTGSVSWFKNQTGGSPLASTNSFTTPELRETTSFWVQTNSLPTNSTVVLGESDTTSSTYSNPFYSLWSNIHTQHLITAEELLSYGLRPGPITSIAVEVTNVGTLPMKDLSIKIGSTNSNNLDSFTTLNGATVPFFTSASYAPIAGLNTFVIENGFIWDGTSNIVIEFCHGNSSSSATMSRTMKMVSTSYNSSVKSHISSATSAATICANTSSSLESYKMRPQFIFEGQGICTSPRTEVIATVTPPPALVLSHEGITLCAGENQLVTITEGLANYDSFVWTPNTGITGDVTTGWTFAPTVNTNYTLRASQNSGSCVTEVKLNVIVNPLPAFTPISENFTICANEIQELDSKLITQKIVTIGEGRTTTIQVTNSEPSAFMNRWSKTKQQIIYTKEDLNNLGVYSGEIKELAFEINSLGSAANNADYTIKMKPVTESYFINNTFSTENFITVFGPINYTHTASGWQNFVLTTPYTWDGISNILIELTHDGANSTNNAETYYTETEENTVILTMGNSGITADAANASKMRLNVRFKVLTLPNISWSPFTNLYLDAGATQPYTGENVTKVYVKGTENSSTNYTFTMVTDKGCTSSDSTTVNIINVTEPVVANQTICEPEIANIVISGQDEGGTFKWYATENGIEEITSITESGTYYVEQVLGTCKSDRISVDITYNPILPAPTAEDQLFCEVTNLATVEDLQIIEATGTIGWFLTEDSESPLANTTELVTGTYYVAQSNGNCWSPKAAIEVESRIIPVAPTGGSQAFCGALNLADVPLAVVPGGVINWYDTATSIERFPLTDVISNRSYYISQSIGNCESPRVLLQISVIPTLQAPTAPTGVLYCDAITFNDLEVNLATGGIKGWFSSATLAEPDLNLTSQVITGTYYVAQYNGVCWSPKTQVRVTVNTTPAALNNRTQQLCGVFTLADANLGQTAGAIVNFYASESSSDLLPLNTPLVTGRYYVSQQLGGCESPKVAVNFEVAEILVAPQTQPNQLYCGPTTVADLNATPSQNGIIGWFTSLASNTPLNNTSSVQTGTYFVAQRNAHCWSEKVRVQITVNPIPSNLNNTTQLLCGTYRFEDIAVGATTGSTVNWYSADGNTRLPLNGIAQSGNYYISQTINNCESARLPITLTVTGTLNKPIANTQTICGSGTVSNLVAEGISGASIVWYTSLTSNLPLAANTPLATGTYYVAQTMNGCFSERRAVAVRVVSTTAPQVNPFMICGSGTVADLIIPAATGITYNWYNSPTSTNQLTQSTPLTTGTYFVERNHYGCISARTAVQVTIGNVPNAPTGSTTQTFIEGSTIANLVINQTNVVWYATYNDSQNGTNPLALNMPLVNGQTYYAVIIGTNGCPSLPLAVTVDVYLSKDEFAKSELKYYPNPVIDILNLSYSETITQIEIFDLLGKRIKTVNTNDNNVELDLSDLATGTYMLQLKSENKEQYIKIVKK